MNLGVTGAGSTSAPKRTLPAANNRTQKPLSHYEGIYNGLAADEIASRCALDYDRDAKCFALRLMGDEMKVSHPEFSLASTKVDKNTETAAGAEAPGVMEKLLVLRYLTDGRYKMPVSRELPYDDVPWGSVYYSNFRGRCVLRAARTFGGDVATLAEVFDSTPGLNAERIDRGDIGYRFEFMNGLYMSLIIWEGDDEFPASAQVLFDDNFVSAFTAEDIAVAGEIMVSRLKKMMNNRKDD
jgi:hypothetical protein